MKTYPFSIQKNAHSIEFYYNHIKNTLADMESGEIPMDRARYDRLADFLDRELLDGGVLSMLPNVDGTLVRVSAGDVVDRLLPATGHGYEVLEPEDPAWAPMEERKESLK